MDRSSPACRLCALGRLLEISVADGDDLDAEGSARSFVLDRSPLERPMRALPRGDPGETTSTPSPFSSIEPTKKRSVSSSPS